MAGEAETDYSHIPQVAEENEVESRMMEADTAALGLVSGEGFIAGSPFYMKPLPRFGPCQIECYMKPLPNLGRVRSRRVQHLGPIKAIFSS